MVLALPILSVSHLTKVFPDGSSALNNLNLTLEEGEILSLLGPSGCGKTTTLRCIAGLEEPNSGSIVISGKTVFGVDRGKVTSVPPEKRNLAMVFQQYALWPHFDVLGNVAFALKSQRMSKAEIEEAAREALTKVGLWGKRHSKISQLSGGQQQRVALARAFAAAPSIILFDEPLSNLDARLREEMRYELLRLQQALGFSAVYVTHDQEEALSLSSRIAVMNGGVIEQFDTPFNVWRRPASGFVADFLGGVNSLRGVVRQLPGNGGAGIVELQDGLRLDVAELGSDIAVQQEVDVFLREGDLSVALKEPERAKNVWKVKVTMQSFHGDYIALKVALGNSEISCRIYGRSLEAVSSHVYITAAPGSILAYPSAALT
ncbi:MAG: transporter-related protein [Schumannella sp.]|nr:transporter-related protein [Schumannella sp.]